jgi:pyridoxal phosphate enzyme (YggS family)
MSIGNNLEKLRKTIPSYVKIVAVSKTKPAEDILKAYETGHRAFGENKVQELIAKQPLLPENIHWHMIGHLQTNKVKYIAPFVDMIESVDSLKLLREINKQALKNNRVIKCLLQFHIASEETKFGLSTEEAEQILLDPSFGEMKNITINGVMGMATFTDDESILRKEFSALKKYFDYLKNKHYLKNKNFCEISMGMTGDYRIAIEEGSTMVRIGTAIFGERYHQ